MLPFHKTLSSSLLRVTCIKHSGTQRRKMCVKCICDHAYLIFVVCHESSKHKVHSLHRPSAPDTDTRWSGRCPASDDVHCQSVTSTTYPAEDKPPLWCGPYTVPVRSCASVMWRQMKLTGKHALIRGWAVILTSSQVVNRSAGAVTAAGRCQAHQCNLLSSCSPPTCSGNRKLVLLRVINQLPLCPLHSLLPLRPPPPPNTPLPAHFLSLCDREWTDRQQGCLLSFTCLHTGTVIMPVCVSLTWCDNEKNTGWHRTDLQNNFALPLLPAMLHILNRTTQETVSVPCSKIIKSRLKTEKKGGGGGWKI